MVHGLWGTRWVALAGLVTTLSCFSGDATIGARCESDEDCGAGQHCDNAVCGRCGDGSAQPGELCLHEGATVALGDAATLLRPRDVDRDGVLDLITLRPGEDQIAVLRGGDGRFAAPERVALPATARLLAVGDLDGDGTVDAIVADDAAIRVGVGAGTLVFSFGPGTVDWNTPTGLALAPAGAAEAGAYLVATRVEGAQTQIGAMAIGHDGTLRIEAERLLPASAKVMAAGEVVGGAETEVVVFAPGELRLLRGPMLVDAARVEVAVEVVCVQIVDGSGDGRPDLLTGDVAGQIVIHVGDGEGEFATESLLTLDAPVRAVALADLNRDSQGDLVAATAGGVHVALANGPRFVSPVVLPGPRDATALYLAELTADVLPELVVASPGAVVVLEADP